MKKLVVGVLVVVSFLSAWAGTWVYENATITDGDWVLSTSSSKAGLTVTGVTTVGTQGTEIDLQDVADLPADIVAIGGNAFKSKTTITSVKLPTTLTSIGNWAFGYCSSLTNVVPFLPASLTSIGAAAFRSAPVQNDLTIANPNFKSIPYDDNYHGVFRGIKSKVVDLSQSGITSIGSRAFLEDSMIERLYLPSTLTSIGNWVFGDCSSLTNVVPFLPASLTSIGAAAFRRAPVQNDLTIANANFKTIPNADNYNGVFGGIKSKVVDLSQSGLTAIGSYAFNSDTMIESVKLPETVQSIGKCGFSNCTKLSSVEPFLPGALTSIGQMAFYSCPIENDLILSNPNLTSIAGDDNRNGVFSYIRSKAVDLSQSGLTSIGAYAFRYSSTITTLKLPETLTTINRNAFEGCTALKTVTPFFPGALKTLGAHAFVSCPLEGDLVITNGAFTTIPYANDTWVGMFQSSKITSADFTGSGLASMGRYVFRYCTSLTSVKFPDTFASLDQGVLSGCTALTNTTFLSYPSTTFSANAFNSVGPSNLASRILYPKTNEGWKDRIRTDSTFKAWEDLAADKQAIYEALYPAGPTPKGYSTFDNRLLWLVPVSDGAGIVHLHVVAEPEDVGAVDPAYGIYENVGEQLPILCTNSLFGATSTIGYSNTCCRVEVMGEEWWEPVETLPDTLSYTFNPANEGTYRVLWQWQPVGYALNVPASTLGSVAQAGATIAGLSSYGTYYVSNTVVTLTATATGGTFLRWYGDVPAGHETDNPLAITMERAKTVSPYFDSAEWTYDGSANTISDGNWTLNVSGSSAGLSVTGVKAVDSTVAYLDLSKPVNGATITSIAGSAFNGRSQLETVKLPATLTSIGNWAFGNCTKLKHVIPFLPDALTSIGSAAFRSAPVEDDLTIANPNFTTIPNDDNYHGTFRGIKSKVVDLSQSGITSIGSRAFLEDSMIERLYLPPTVTSIGAWAFGSCSKLAHVEPFLPDSLTSIGQAAFRSCPITNDLTIANANFKTIPNDDNFHGVFKGIKSKVVDLSQSGITSIGSEAFSTDAMIESVKLPETVQSIGKCGFCNCTKLSSVEPFLPSALTSIGQMAFYSCPIENDLILSNPDLKTIPVDDNNNGVFQSIRSKVVDMTESGVNNIGTYAFRNCSMMETIRFSPAMGQINNYAFNGCSGLRNVYWHHSTALTFGGSWFAGISALQVRHFIPRNDDFWATYLAESCTLETPLTDAEQAVYATKFPGMKMAKGKIKLPTAAANQYYLFWNPDKIGFGIILR